ncbi:hypothetical protein V6N11_022687 [Hibiscus sabdariffa]|uniref:Uncharacterized protein n=1 Tax=Hibiscus sabdariffa TaxID=183260 RepID=A0ABR2TKA5_9ROSI
MNDDTSGMNGAGCLSCHRRVLDNNVSCNTTRKEARILDQKTDAGEQMNIKSRSHRSVEITEDILFMKGTSL